MNATMSYKTLYICLKSSLLLCFLLFLQTSYGQINLKELDQALSDKQKLLGKDLVMLVWKKNDSIIYKKEMGDFKSNTQAPIASCSKWLTAALVMIFVDEGKISLDDPVVKYIPEFGKYFKSYTTIGQCLSQMTGIDDEGRLLKKILHRRKISSLEEEVNGFAAREIRANPGTDFWYGNVGLNIAGRVLEVVSKKKFELLVKQKLFNPLAMRKSTFSTLDYSAVNPSGGALSTADDYMNFLVMLMNKGRFRGRQILSEDAVNYLVKTQTKTSQVKYAPKSAEGFNYASGAWVLEKDKNGQALTIASPGLFGTWPMIDFCRGYAYIVFVKNFLEEDRADVHLELKKIIDNKISSTCK